jgi:hypothetical protein
MTAAQQSAPIRASEGTPAPRWWNLEPREGAMLAGILVATALLYLPSLRNGWVYDDPLQIVDNDLLHSWAGIGKSFIYDSWWFLNPDRLPRSAYYRPLQATWYGLNYMILGNHPAAWHLEKIVVELIAVMLCFRLAQLLTRSTAIALLTAAIFGMLSANVEAVVWASAIGEPLSAIFEMGALCCLIKREPGRRWSRGLVFALMLYTGALLSHETAVLFWLIIAAYGFLIEGKRVGESMRFAAPFLVLAIAYLAARLYALGTAAYFAIPYHQPAFVLLGWGRPVPPPSILGLILTAPVAFLGYLGVLAIPGMAGPAHNLDWVSSVAPITFISAGILAVLAGFALAAAWRSSSRNLYLFCAAWSLITFAPSMKLNAIAALIADRVLYAPSFGFSLALATIAVHLAAVSPRARTAVTGAMAILLASYAVSAARIEHYWHDDGTFYAACVARAPHDREFLRKQVEILNDQDDSVAAMNALQNAVTRDPDSLYLHQRLLDQYVLMQRGADIQAEVVRMHAISEKERAAP